jgi:hypothetical protein
MREALETCEGKIGWTGRSSGAEMLELLPWTWLGFPSDKVRNDGTR